MLGKGKLSAHCPGLIAHELLIVTLMSLLLRITRDIMPLSERGLHRW
jgi:hypothetical protein